MVSSLGPRWMPLLEGWLRRCTQLHMTEWNRFKHIQLGTLAKLGFSERCPVWGPPGQLPWKPDFAGVPSCMWLNQCLWPGWARTQLDSRGRILGGMPSWVTCDRMQVRRLHHCMWLDKMLLTWRVRLGALFRLTFVWIQACGHVCMGVSVDGQIQEWQTGTQGSMFPANWNWVVGGGLESSQQDCLGKTSMSSPAQGGEMARRSLGKWFGMPGWILLDT